MSIHQILFLCGTTVLSFVLALWLHDTMPQTLTTTAIVFTLGLGVIVAIEQWQLYREGKRLRELKEQYQHLKKQFYLLQTQVVKIRQTKNELFQSLKGLQGERTKVLKRLSDLYHYRQEVQKSILRLYKQKETLTQQKAVLQVKLPDKEQAKAQVTQAIAEGSLVTQLKAKSKRLQTQIDLQQKQQQQIHRQIALIAKRKQYLEGSIYDLKTEISALKQQHRELHRHLSELKHKRLDLSASVLSGQAALENLIDQIALQKREAKSIAAHLLELQEQQQDVIRHLSKTLALSELMGQEGTEPGEDNLLEMVAVQWQQWLQLNAELTREQQRILETVFDHSPLPRDDRQKLSLLDEESSPINQE